MPRSPNEPAPDAATKAVVLAAGRGTRMQRIGAGAAEGDARGDQAPDSGQRWAAERGLKPLIPFHGHPFLAYGLSALAEAGIQEVCVVVRPDGSRDAVDPIRSWVRSAADAQRRRLRIDCAVQERPEGSARALLAAAKWVGEDPFVTVNADNLYPADVLDRVRRLPGSGLAGFGAVALVEMGGIPSTRIASFALLEVDAHGCLVDLVEKPDADTRARFGADPRVSMNCWRFTPGIFDACREVRASPRGEFELPAAVLDLVRSGGECVTVVPVDAGVLDLTGQDDIAAVEEALRGREASW
jgi:dTDP-glucose pyrophosphorylase